MTYLSQVTTLSNPSVTAGSKMLLKLCLKTLASSVPHNSCKHIISLANRNTHLYHTLGIELKCLSFCFERSWLCDNPSMTLYHIWYNTCIFSEKPLALIIRIAEISFACVWFACPAGLSSF